MSNATHSAAESLNHALTADEAMQDQRERATAGRIFIVLAMLVALLAVLVFLFGLPALTYAALAGTAIVMLTLVAYATGF